MAMLYAPILGPESSKRQFIPIAVLSHWKWMLKLHQLRTVSLKKVWVKNFLADTQSSKRKAY
jgi:hypothetical protein